MNLYFFDDNTLCDINDCEDSRPLEDRPSYEPLKLLNLKWNN